MLTERDLLTKPVGLCVIFDQSLINVACGRRGNAILFGKRSGEPLRIGAK